MLEIKKIRLYVEDQVVPSPARTMRMVVDFLTNENVLKFPLEKEQIEDMTIFGVNRDWEIPFIEEKDNLIINLGDLNQWIGVEDDRGLKHVKLEIKFVLVNPDFRQKRFNRGYHGSFELSESEELELHITLPLGMKMGKTFQDPEIGLSIYGDNQQMIMIPASGVLQEERKRRYDFLISPDNLENIKLAEKSHKSIEIDYNVINEKEYYIITVIGLGIFAFAIYRFFDMLDLQIEFDIRYLAAAVAFISIYLTLLREKYEIPFRKVLGYTTVIVGLEIIIELSLEKWMFI